MRRIRPMSVLLLAAACATPPRLVVTATDTVTSVPEAAVDLAAVDVVVLGETHETPDVHGMHLDLLHELHSRRPDVVIAMEMFERDVQGDLMQYVGGVMDEASFLAKARPWPHYERDYRPVVEFAKENGLVVLAANAPKDLAARVAKDGIGAIAGEPLAPRATTAPEDEYWDSFVDAMKEGEGAHGAAADPAAETARLHRYYEAQCLRDDTMAETIVDHLRAGRAAGRRPIYVLFCGRQHSDYGRGVVARIKSRMPDLAVRVVSTERVTNLAASTFASPKNLADYVIVREGPAERRAGTPPAHPVHGETPVAKADPHGDPHAADPHAGAAGKQEGGEQPSQRPALGLMPDYQNSEGKGVLVANVREGGSAYKAGIEPGDYIVNVGGIEVTDVQTYTEALDQMVIGRTITVRIRRDDAEVALQVLVAARSR